MALPEALSEAPRSEFPGPLGPAGIELVGVDLTGDPRWSEERLASCVSTEPDGRSAGLPSDGFVSPIGFLFTVAKAPDEDRALLRVSVQNYSDQSAIDRAVARLRKSGHVSIVNLRCLEPADCELTLVVGAMGAEVFADDAAWAALAEPVLLYVAQYARYCAIEREFLKLQAEARRDHHHAVDAGLRSLRAQRRLTQTSLDVRDRVSDWTYFSGPAADPRRACSSEEALGACAILAEKLEIEPWTEGVGALVEDVEQTYETLSDKLFQYRLFLWAACLEIVIAGLIIGLFFR